MTSQISKSHSPPTKESQKIHIRFATQLSVFASAPVLSIPTFILIILYHQGRQSNMFLDILISMVFGFFLPLLVALSFSRKNNTTYDERETRIKPLLYVSAIYITGSTIFVMLLAPVDATLLMFCYGTNTFTVYVINLRWKISIHAMGVAGPTTALLYSFGVVGGLLGLLLLPVLWSRLYLKKHTPAQVIAGASLGYVLTSIQFFILASIFFRNTLNLSFVSMAILSLMMPVIIPVFYEFSARTIHVYAALVIVFTSLVVLLLWTAQTNLILLLLLSVIINLLAFWLLPTTYGGKIIQNKSP